jgi:phage gp36-like protein
MKSVIASLFVAVVLLSSSFTPAAWAQAQPAGSTPPGYVLVEEDVIVTFADEPKQSFRAAVAAYLNRQMRTAATEIRKAAAYLKLEAGRATGDARKALMDSVQELEKLAGDVQKGTVADLKELQNAFARAEHALARHHYLKAVELRAKIDAQKTGRALQSAADYVDSGQVWLTQKMHEGVADSVNEARRVAAKMVYGTGAAADEVGKAFDGLGKELDKFGSAVAGLKK